MNPKRTFEYQNGIVINGRNMWALLHYSDVNERSIFRYKFTSKLNFYTI